MVSNPRFLTADELFELPVPDDLVGYELVDGRPVPVMPASLTHGQLSVEVSHRLRAHVENTGLTGVVCYDCAFRLGLARDPERVRAPDVSYISREKVEAHGDPDLILRCAPDLAIEVDLTSARKPGGQQRIVDLIEAGTRLVWAIDAASRSAVEYYADGSARLVRHDGVLDAGDVVPGFRLPLAELFEGLEP